MKNRRVLIDIDSMLSILKDYAGDAAEIPMNAKPVGFCINPQEQGKLAIRMECDTWEKELPPVFLTFQLKRFYGV